MLSILVAENLFETLTRPPQYRISNLQFVVLVILMGKIKRLLKVSYKYGYRKIIYHKQERYFTLILFRFVHFRCYVLCKLLLVFIDERFNVI